MRRHIRLLGEKHLGFFAMLNMTDTYNTKQKQNRLLFQDEA